MALFLLDTDAIIDHLHDFTTSVDLIRDLYERGEDLCTCSVVVAEVYAGLHPADEVKAATLLIPMRYLPVSREAAEQAGRWRYEFSRRGIQLGAPDALIAATAFSHGATLVTANLRHFPMPEIKLLSLRL